MADYVYPPRRHGDDRRNGYHYDDYRPSRHYNPERRHTQARPPDRHRDRDYAPVATPRDRRSQRHGRDYPPPEQRRDRRRTRSVDRHDYGHRHRDPYAREHRRRRHHSDSPSRDSPRGHGRGHNSHAPRRRRAVSDTRPDEKLNNAAKAAINAAAVEAIRVRGQPGEWAGPKGVRVATAALGAAATDAAADKFHEGDGDEKKGKRDHIKSAIGGLLANRVLNGPRDELRRHQ